MAKYTVVDRKGVRENRTEQTRFEARRAAMHFESLDVRRDAFEPFRYEIVSEDGEREVIP